MRHELHQTTVALFHSSTNPVSQSHNGPFHQLSPSLRYLFQILFRHSLSIPQTITPQVKKSQRDSNFINKKLIVLLSLKFKSLSLISTSLS